MSDPTESLETQFNKYADDIKNTDKSIPDKDLLELYSCINKPLVVIAIHPNPVL